MKEIKILIQDLVLRLEQEKKDKGGKKEDRKPAIFPTTNSKTANIWNFVYN